MVSMERNHFQLLQSVLEIRPDSKLKVFLQLLLKTMVPLSVLSWSLLGGRVYPCERVGGSCPKGPLVKIKSAQLRR